MTRKQKEARMKAEKYAQKKAVAEQAAAEQAEKEAAPFILEQLEQEIERDYNITPPFTANMLSNEIPWYLFNQWNRYNDIVNPEPQDDTQSEQISDVNHEANGFGIDFKKAVNKESEPNLTLDDIYEEEFQEVQNIPDDAPSSVKRRDLPRGWLNVCDKNDDFSFDEMDDDCDDPDGTGYDYGDN